MRLSTKGRYGVRAMFDLALHSGEGAIALKSVAQREHISEKYLEHLFASLKKAGLIRSVRGAQGGYRLARPPEEITLGDIIRVLEGPIAPTECVIDDDGHESCERSTDCVMRSIWGNVRDQINEILDGITLAQIVEEQRKMSGKGYMYYI
ncbi:RrF2 family transcriptional regulator [Dethiobacter alkaliphilus]|uniref:Transcriptional regulator, BadM/Rrf2 family n=1 Tax=Dethiobacter alkaliphilus AHT 1 TaxID=555088 RepID=C0GFZ2_DETAL|nr:Rrf2 family transcriptional regulator [Dethiobacter alkaliphilus]EEG77681.1 transcriptional regulator, BadM/Rrf2 family [Dethiobacter alkaliphilus AHT 1]